jgi:hypothetical protein
MEYEYATTKFKMFDRDHTNEQLKPVKPEGHRWRLVKVLFAENNILWFWERPSIAP